MFNLDSNSIKSNKIPITVKDFLDNNVILNFYSKKYIYYIFFLEYLMRTCLHLSRQCFELFLRCLPAFSGRHSVRTRFADVTRCVTCW